MLGWFDRYPKTFSDFLEKILNNFLGFLLDIRKRVWYNANEADHKMDPKSSTQDTSCSYFIMVCFVRLAFRLGFPKHHLLSQELRATSQRFLQ